MIQNKLLGAFFLFQLAHAQVISEITPAIALRLTHSWKDNNPVPLHDLRLVTVDYYGFDGQIHQGDLIVHKKVAEEIVAIFQELLEHNYPIEKIILVDEYRADDELSARDNNTYSFCSRAITGKPGTFSKHSYGIAIDINPLYNPYHKDDIVIPITGAQYLDRRIMTPVTITHESACFCAFIKRGWQWGGDWGARGLHDYHHFEKDLSVIDD